MKKRMSRLQNRVELFPILFEEMLSNLLNFDEDWNPFLSQIGCEDFDQVESAQIRLLLVIQRVEGFLTKLIINKHSLFEVEIKSDKDYVPQSRRPLEESLFSFNYIFQGNSIRTSQEKLEMGVDCFCQEIQYGVDLELFLEVLGGILPEHFNTSYKFLGFSSGKFSHRAYVDTPEIRSIQRLNYPAELSTKNPTFNHMKVLNIAEFQLRRLLNSSEHTKLLNNINTNALARQRRASEYMDSLFERHKALTFVTMDLCFQYEMKFSEKQKTLAAFKNGMRKHPVFNKIVGYLGKWEYSFTKDSYIRMIFIFPKLQLHVQDQMPEIIAALWLKYTKGMAHRAYLASQPLKLNQTICSIARNNKDLRTEFEQRTLYYLAHSQEYYRYKYNNDYHGKRYKSLSSSKNSEPRDIFFKGELTGEALERKLQKKDRKLKKISGSSK